MRKSHTRAGIACPESTEVIVAQRRRWSLALAGIIAGLLAVTVAAPAAAGPEPAGIARPAADTQPPTPPKSLKAGKVTQTSVALSWGASTDNVGVVAYDIYQQGQLMKSVDGKTLKTTVSGLTPNTDYGFYVNARDAAHNVSQASNTVSVTTLKSGDTTPPSTPTNLKSTGTTANTVSLSWTASTDNVGVAGYYVYSSGNQVGQTTTTSDTVDGLAPQTRYTFTVKAYDAAGNLSTASNPVTVTTAPGGGGGGTIPGQVTQITTDNDVPWGLVFLPDGTALFNERDKHDLVHVDAKGDKTTVTTIPGVSGTDGEGGLLGLEISPTFTTDHWLYFYFTTSTDNRIARFRYDNGQLDVSSEQVLLKGIQRNKFHNGGRLRFGPDGKLYAGVGDAENTANPQNINSLNGKILRLNPDGSVPADNPFHNYVWSYGHRNVEGLAFDSKGRLWEAELGNNTMDELNLIVKGGDYGWPDCEGTAGSCSNPKYIAPVQTWPVANASPSGLACVHDVLFMAALRGQRLWRMQITGDTTTRPVAYFQGEYGRLRTVEASPDGGLWLTNSSGDKDSTPGNSNDEILHIQLR